MNEEFICPWPGPKPYTFTDASRFFGRENDIDRLESSIVQHRLTLLLASSGAGKTSLLQAGLLPRLWARRLERNSRIGHPVLVRSWAELGKLNACALIVRAIEKAVSDRYSFLLENGDDSLLLQEAQEAYQVSSPEIETLKRHQDQIDAVVQYLQELSHATRGLVLIVDQAEELLGSALMRKEPGRENLVLALFGAIHRSVQGCHLIISMREDYRARISRLGSSVPGLEKRQLLIDPLPVSVAKTALREAVTAVKRVRIEDEGNTSILSTLMSWLIEGEGVGTDGSGEVSDATPVDLLRLQALLVAVFEHAVTAARRSGKEEVVLNKEILDTYVSELDQAEGDSGRPLKARDLGRHALERYIDKVFEPTGPDAGGDGPLLKYLVVRMSRWLSSPEGFKRHIKSDDLIYNAIRDDLEGLGAMTEGPAVRELLRTNGDLRDVKFSSQGEDESSCGLSWGMAPEDIADHLVASCQRALKLLEDQSILKSSDGGDSRIYELVHDGLGPALYEWAEKRRRLLEDTLAAIVSRRGENFIWTPPHVSAEVFQNLRWLGCNLRAVDFVDSSFVGCDLRGTIFLNCDFTQCTFEGCNLDGTVFIGGRWDEAVWKDCTARSTLIKEVTWQGVVRFLSTSLENASVLDIKAAAKVDIHHCSSRFAQIRSISPLSSSFGLNVRASDFTNALFEDLSIARLDAETETYGVLEKCGPPKFGPDVAEATE